MINFFAEPVVSTDGKLHGVSLRTTFHHEDMPVVNSQYYIMQLPLDEKKRLLKKMLTEIQIAASWFREYGVFCILNVDRHLAYLCAYDTEIKNWLRELAFIRLEISEHLLGQDHGINAQLQKKLINNGHELILNNVGVGTAVALTSGLFGTVKLDRAFYRLQVKQTFFKTFIENIKRYCSQVIVEGVEADNEIEILKEAKVWGVQGYLYRSVPFSKVQTLL